LSKAYRLLKIMVSMFTTSLQSTVKYTVSLENIQFQHLNFITWQQHLYLCVVPRIRQ
jgi:hypothetical protein